MKKSLDLYDSFSVKASMNKDNRKFIFSDSGEVRSGTSLICDIAASHSGTLINNRIYPPNGMKRGVKSWTTPYKKPVLVNHDEESSPIGRVIKARYVKTPRALESKDYSPILKPTDGYGYIALTVKVTDQAAIEKILDGRYETVSVRMSTDHAFCSICDTDWATEGPCEHMPGKKYEDKLAYMTTGDLRYKEVSFVNIPADEYAKVEGSVFEDNVSDPVEMEVYANNAEEKVLCNLNDENGSNLYDYLRDEYDEEEETIFHLIDKSRMEDKNLKEDQMSKEKELTKDQLKEMDSVKELIQEAVDASSKSCEEQLNKLKEECTKASDGSGYDELKKELEETKDKLNAAIDAQTALSKEKESLEQERDQIKDELGKKEDESKTILDENVSLNSELHKVNAERLFDLKSSLNKPDVNGIKTIEDRNKKVDEFAQRSTDSLKDQINDLIIEKNAAPGAIKADGVVDNPGIVNEDGGKEEGKDSKNKKETKNDTLDRLFSSKNKK